MGLILIIIGIIIQRALYKSNINNLSEDYFENTSRFILDPTVRFVLRISSWALSIIGVLNLF